MRVTAGAAQQSSSSAVVERTMICKMTRHTYCCTAVSYIYIQIYSSIRFVEKVKKEEGGRLFHL